MHIGKQSQKCPEVKVHNDNLKMSVEEKNLGDVLSSEGSLDVTIQKRTNKAWSYKPEIRAIINEFPISKRKTQVALML